MKRSTFVRGRDVENPNDVIFTPKRISEAIINKLPFKSGESILDPCRGEGSYYNQFPKKLLKDWCEITEGVDFFDVNKQYEWVVSNPPYSMYEEFMDKGMEISDNVVYLIPLTKLVSSMGRLRKIWNYGGIVSIDITSAKSCEFPLGYPIASVHVKKGYNGKTQFGRILSDNTELIHTKRRVYNLGKVDDVETPKPLAKKIIESLPYKDGDSFLDPAAGHGTFFKLFPKNNGTHDWDEIKKGRDFYEREGAWEWIVSSIPSSHTTEFLEKGMEIGNNLVYVLPISKIVSSFKRMDLILRWGGIVSIKVFSGSKGGYNFGFPICAIHIKKGYKGATLFEELK